MKSEMSGAVDQGPKKLDKSAYNEMKQQPQKNPLKQEPEQPAVFGAPIPESGGGQSKNAKRRAKKKAKAQEPGQQ